MDADAKTTRRNDVEAALRAALERGDYEGAASAAVRAYGHELYRFLQATVHNTADASDLSAELWEEIWRSLPQFELRSSFRTWAYLLARHACTRYLRSAWRRNKERLSTTQIARLEQKLRTTQWKLCDRADDELDKIRATLSPEERMLLFLRVDRNLGWREIAFVMHEGQADARTEARLRRRFARLVERMRELARERGLLPQG